MILKKNYKKPFFKDLLIARKNVLNIKKVYYFKKKKWENFIFFSKKNFKFFKRRRYYDQHKLNISKFSSSGNVFKKQFKNFLIKLKQLKILYGEKKKKQIRLSFLKTRGIFNKSISKNLKVLLGLEYRLDTIINRTKFCITQKQAQQFISHGHILINGKKVTSCSHVLKKGDIIEVLKTKNSTDIVKQNLMKSTFWPIPPFYLKINYKTLTIIITEHFSKNAKIFLPFHLNINFLNNKIKYV